VWTRNEKERKKRVSEKERERESEVKEKLKMNETARGQTKKTVPFVSCRLKRKMTG